MDDIILLLVSIIFSILIIIYNYDNELIFQQMWDLIKYVWKKFTFDNFFKVIEVSLKYTTEFFKIYKLYMCFSVYFFLIFTTLIIVRWFYFKEKQNISKWNFFLKELIFVFTIPMTMHLLSLPTFIVPFYILMFSFQKNFCTNNLTYREFVIKKKWTFWYKLYNAISIVGVLWCGFIICFVGIQDMGIIFIIHMIYVVWWFFYFLYFCPYQNYKLLNFIVLFLGLSCFSFSWYVTGHCVQTLQFLILFYTRIELVDCVKVRDGFLAHLQDKGRIRSFLFVKDATKYLLWALCITIFLNCYIIPYIYW